MSSAMNKGSTMSSIAVGDRVIEVVEVLDTPPEAGTGTVIDICTIPGNPWPVTVRMDKGSDWVYAFTQLKRIDEWATEPLTDADHARWAESE